MPAGSAIFEGTDPTCTAVTDGVEYRCVLASAPTEEVLDPYRGMKQLTVNLNDTTMSGGCSFVLTLSTPVVILLALTDQEC